MNKPSLPSIAGGAVIAVLLVLVVSVGLVATSLFWTSGQNRMAVRQREVMESVAAADGALEYVYAVWRDLIRTNPGVTLTNTDFDADARLKKMESPNNSTSSPAKELTENGNTVTLSNFEIIASDPWGNTPGAAKYDVAVPDYPGWKGTSNYYRATITATGPKTLAGSDNVKASVRRYFSKTTVPLFQAAIFYMGDLEIHPGAEMTVRGLVHSNANLYASGYAKLKFLDNVSYSGIFKEEAQSIGDWTGANGGGADPTIAPYWSDDKQSLTSTTFNLQVHKVDRMEPFGTSAASVFDPYVVDPIAHPVKDTNDNNDGYHEWIEPPVAASGVNADPKEISDQRLYNKADLRIEIDSSLPTSNPNRIKITDGDGKKLKGSDDTYVRAAIAATTNMYDWREGGGNAGASSGSIRVTNIDVKLLNTALNEFKKTASFNGVVYVRDAASTKDAIRLKNGSELAMDLTVASENPVYIQGDYNTGFGPGSTHNPNSVPTNNGGNTNGTEEPVVPGYTKKSAAVIADAVVVLSNNWDDANAAKTLGYRLAKPTTVNAAFMAGDVPTNYKNNGTASGGAHNFPRFLEAWYDTSTNQYVDFTYYGSMVEAFNSKTFTGAWSTGNVYVWPNRKWNFEQLFTSNPPPGTVSGTTYSRGRWQRVNL